MKLTTKSFLKEERHTNDKTTDAGRRSKSHSFSADTKTVQRVGICGCAYLRFAVWSPDFFLSVSCCFLSQLLVSDTPSLTWWGMFSVRFKLWRAKGSPGGLAWYPLDAGCSLGFWMWWGLKFCISNKLQGNADAADSSSFHHPRPRGPKAPPWLGQPSSREVSVSGEDGIGYGEGDSCPHVPRVSFFPPKVSRTRGNAKTQAPQPQALECCFGVLRKGYNLEHAPPANGRHQLDRHQFSPPCKDNSWAPGKADEVLLPWDANSSIWDKLKEVAPLISTTSPP